MAGSMAGRVANGHGSIVLRAAAALRGTPYSPVSGWYQPPRGVTSRPWAGGPLEGLAILRDNHGTGEAGLVSEADAELEDAVA